MLIVEETNQIPVGEKVAVQKFWHYISRFRFCSASGLTTCVTYDYFIVFGSMVQHTQEDRLL